MLILRGVPEIRFDLSRLNKESVERLSTGGVRVPARLTRVGVFDYRQPDGSVRRELRPSNEVFDAASLASLEDAPVVEGHPAMVDPANHKDLARGHVSGLPRQDGKLVAAKLAIQDGETIAKVDRGDLTEISCGYTCDMDPTPGEFEGKKYDAIQRNIRYNHVGMGPRNWGRQGNEVALRLDGGAYTDLPQEQQKRTMKIRFDGRDYESGSEEHVLAISTKLDAADAAAKETQRKLDQADAALVAEKAERAKLQAKLDTFDADVSARADLLAKAQAALGATVKLDGKSDREVKAAVVALAYPEAKLDGKSDDYVTALFDQAIATNVRADSINRLPEVLRQIQQSENQETKEDAAPAPKPEVWAMSKEGAK